MEADLEKLNARLIEKVDWYKSWHHNKRHPIYHWLLFISIGLLVVTNLCGKISSTDFYFDTPIAFAQASPTTQPLVQASDVVYLGVIRVPSSQGLGVGPSSLGVDGNKLYYGCRTGVGVAVLTLPAIGGTAQVISPCAPLPNIDQVHKNTNPPYLDIIAGGILPLGGRLIVSGWTYYDGSGGQVKSHWAGPDAASVSGPYAMAVSDVPMQSDGVNTWYRETMVGGYMGIIPLEWRALLGGPALTGQCCVPIISRTSFGPSFSVFDPANVGVVNPIPSKMLVGYPIEHRNLGEWDASPPSTYYGGTDQLGSVGFPAGTRSILLTGRHGDSWCYGPATADPALVGQPKPGNAYLYCYDPYDFLQGNHGPVYRPTMWAYDANDLIAVAQGARKPWDVQPYAKWTLPGISLDRSNLLRAGYYDPTTRRYYVGASDSRDIYVFEITIGANAPVVAPPPVVPPPVVPPADNTAPVLSSILSSSITTSSATITWTTDEASDTQVEYGLTTAYGSSSLLNAVSVLPHSIILNNLAPQTVYHYRVKSRDAAGNLATSGDNTFTTTQIPAVDIPAPTAILSISPSTITTGSNATLTWSSTNANTVSINQGIGNVALAGSQSVSPAVNTTYTLTAVGAGGPITAVATLIVNPVAQVVLAPALAPIIEDPTAPKPFATFQTSRKSMTLGKSAELSWLSRNATAVSIDNGVGAVALSGTTTVSPTTTTKYILTATGAGGRVTYRATIEVLGTTPLAINTIPVTSPTPVAPSTPTPTPSPVATSLYNFGTTTVRLGTRGDNCKAWQQYFNNRIRTNLKVDGVCGRFTIAAAKAWQRSVGLTADGLLGAKSRGRAG